MIGLDDLDALGVSERELVVAWLAAHHAITIHTPLADVVVACRCTPGVQRNVIEWAEHLATEAASGAGLPGAPKDDRPVPDEEAGTGRVIPINRNTTK